MIAKVENYVNALSFQGHVKIDKSAQCFVVKESHSTSNRWPTLRLNL